MNSVYDVYDIDWNRVAKKYQGIIITPYIWERRLTTTCTWYYGWDVASGCIWDNKAIKEITDARKSKGNMPKSNRNKARTLGKGGVLQVWSESMD